MPVEWGDQEHGNELRHLYQCIWRMYLKGISQKHPFTL